MDRPRISLVTPSFNQAAFLEQTLRSVLLQRDRIHEYHVIDGGSTDGSVDVIRRYAAFLDSWVSEPDNGQCDAIDKGFSRCSGDVLFWINSDDLLLPGAIDTVSACFQQHPQADVVTGYAAAIDDDSRVVYARRRPHDRPFWAKLGYTRVLQPATFFTRAIYERVGGLDHNIDCVLDRDLWYRMFDAGACWRHTRQYLAAFRLHQAAKGSRLKRLYRREQAMLRQRYPHYSGGLVRRAAGKVCYKTSQILTGRALLALRDHRRIAAQIESMLHAPLAVPQE